jgi:hypothetical protein
MKQIIQKILAHEERGPYLYGVVLPIISILILMYNYSIDGPKVFLIFNEFTIYTAQLTVLFIIVGAIAGICSKHVENIFLKHKVKDNDSIQNAMNLSKNMTFVFYGAIITFIGLFIYQIVTYGYFISIKNVVSIETGLLYIISMYTLIVLFISVIANIPILNYRFRFGYARMCIKFSLFNGTDELEKIEYLVKGIESYNKFLGTYSDLKLNNPDSVISKLMFEKQENRNNELRELELSFGRGDVGPLDDIRRILSDSNPETFVIKKPRFSKILPLIPAIASILTVGFFAIRFMIDYKNGFGF